MNFLNQAIEAILLKVVAPMVGKLPKGAKTLMGLFLLMLVWVCQTWVVPAVPAARVEALTEVFNWLHGIAWTVFGIGVYHKVAASDPKAISGAAKP